MARRLIARGALIVAAVLAGYVVVEVLGFRATYPDAASRASLEMFNDAPVVRMLQGPPNGIDVAGGFAAWDGGWFMAAIAAIWATLVSTRLLRGEEDHQRTGLLLATPLRARALAAVDLGVIGAACLLYAAVVTIAMGATGESWVGSLLFGAAIGGFAAIWAAVAAVSAEILDSRRHAVSVAALIFGAAYGLRAFANSTEGRGWIRWLTPWGWLDEVEPFAARRVTAIALFWIVALLLAVAAVALRGRRDTEGAIIARPDRRPPRLVWLGGPLPFALRETAGVFVAWLAGLAAWAAMIGTLLGTMLDFIRADEAYRRMLEQMQMTDLLTAKGYVGMLAVLLGVGFSLYVVWRVAAARTEESSGRLETMLVRPLTRRRWLLGHLALGAGAAVVLALACGAVTWLGALSTNADLSLRDSLASTLNQLPVTALFLGVAVLVMGVLPRLTLALPASLVGVGYLVELIGPTLDWPEWVMNLSPFHHVAYVPAESFLAVPSIVMVAIGTVAAAAGVEFFQRRDVVTA